MTGVLEHVRLHKVDSLAALDECRRWAGQTREGPMFFDTESGGLNPHKDRWRMIQLGDLTDGWAFPADGWRGGAVELLTSYQGELGAHNSPYDWRVISVNEPQVRPAWHKTQDTLLAGHVVDSLRLAALKPRAAIEVDPRAMAGEAALSEGMRKQGWTWDTVPFGFEPYWTYGALDTPLAAHLWRKFQPECTGQFRASYEMERATARICAGMMTTGMLTDQPYIRRNMAERLAWYDKAMAWLKSEYKISTVNSNEQVGRALNRAGIPTLMWTDGGKPSISKEALDFYASQYPDHAPLLRTIRTCRKTGDIVHKYLQKFLDMADSDGVIHPQIWTSRARTTRQSVTDPPMQTFDRDEPVVRGCFIPRPGHVFITIDADQIEARLAAHLSGDERMIADFIYADRMGLKFFCVQASRIYSREITKQMPEYTWTKNATYAQIYGSGLENAAATAGVPIDQMRPVYMGFQQLYPAVNRRMNMHISNNRRKGHRPEVSTIMGRRLYGDRGHEYALLNYEIQGSAAEILKTGQIQLEAAGFGPYLRLDIHDEFLIEAPAEYAQEMLDTATRILTDRTNFRVPITWAGSILTERWRKT